MQSREMSTYEILVWGRDAFCDILSHFIFTTIPTGLAALPQFHQQETQAQRLASKWGGVGRDFYPELNDSQNTAASITAQMELEERRQMKGPQRTL